MKYLSVAVCLALLPLPAQAWQSSSDQPSLAEVAQKDKERRAKEKKPAKSFTDADLKSSGRSTFNVMEGVSTTAPAAGEAKAEGEAAPGAAKPKSDDELRAQKKTDLQRRLDEQKKLIEVVQKAVADAQRELGDVANTTYGSRRDALTKRVDDGAKELAKAQQAIADIQDEARRAGITLSN